MKRDCHAFLIDPFTETVAKVAYDGDYRTVTRLIDCQTLDAVRIDRKGNTIFVDDEGLVSDKPVQGMWSYMGENTVQLAGRGLVLGTDGEGESASPTITLEAVASRIVWLGVFRRSEEA